MTEGLKHSPLHDRHVALGAHMGAFAGWDMPISYAGTVAEHTAVRDDVGVFDVSHLGKLLVRGAHARDDLDVAVTNRIAELAVERARYTLLLNDDGGIVDDLIVYVLAQDRVLVVPNAANTDAVMRALESAGARVEHLDWATLAVQGPRSLAVVRATVPSTPDLAYLQCTELDDGLVVSRTGYTGEHGYEIFCAPDRAGPLWDRLVDAGATPCGLAARDTLRLEMGYPLHGNDIDPDTAPREAGLGWAVAKAKPTYIGKEANESRPPRKQLCGIRMLDRVIPRRHAAVRLGGRAIGECTSGTFSPTLRIGIALAYVEPGSVTEGDEVDVDVRAKTGRGVVTKPPFVASDPRSEPKPAR